MHDLFKIVQFGQSIMLNDYLAKNPAADVNMKDEVGDSLLHFTTTRENEEEIRAMTVQLLDVGTNTNVLSSAGYTPLVHLLVNKNLSGHGAASLTGLFIKKGADVNLRVENAVTPLMAAAGNTREWDDSISQLIAAGAYVNAKDDNGNTALFYAVENSEMAHIQTLINAGATVDQSVVNMAKKKHEKLKYHQYWEPLTRTILSHVTAAYEDNLLMAAAQHMLELENAPEEPRATRTRI